MTTVFKNASLNCTTTDAALYTCPAGTQAIVIGLQATNVHASNTADVTLTLNDVSAGTNAKLLNLATVPLQASVGLLAGKLTLDAGDVLKIKATVAGVVDVVASVTEIS